MAEQEQDGAFYAKKFLEELRKLSTFKEDPIPEWEVIEAYKGEGTKCICTKVIENEFVIKNKINGLKVIIGCDCAERFNIEFVLQCKTCSSPLGNKIRRLLNKDLICPACKREERAKRKEYIAALSNYRCWIYGPWYKKRFKDIIENQEWVEGILNTDPSGMYPITCYDSFKEYCNFFYDIKEEILTS